MREKIILAVVIGLMLAGVFAAAGLPGLLICLVAGGVSVGVDLRKQRRREAREAQEAEAFAKLEAEARAKRAPLSRGERSMLDVLREDPEYRPPEPPEVRQDAPDDAVEEDADAAPAAAAPERASAGPRVYPLMKLGSWPQGPNSEREPIEWILLKQEEDRILALSLYILELRPFHTEAASIRWEDSDLRRWLTNDFFDAAFTPEEQDRICQPEPSEDPGGEMLWQMFGMETVTSAIDDRVFALNATDLSEFFPGENAMFHPGCTAEPTRWVEAQGEGDPAESSWWLRSSMRGAAMAFIASPANSMGVSAIGPNNVNGVRPAIWVWKNPGANRQALPDG